MEKYNFSLSLDIFDSMQDMLDINILADQGCEDEFPPFMSTFASEDRVPDADENWQTTTTNEIYADFDSYIDPAIKCPSVASFGDVMDFHWRSHLLPIPQEPTTLSPPKMHEIQRQHEQLPIIATTNEHKMDGLLTLANMQKTAKVKPIQKRRIAAAKENIVDNNVDAKGFQKPTFSFSCLIAMAMKNSPTGCLIVGEIYSFICTHFPYYKTAPCSWRNSIRHSLSMNKNFIKEESYNERKQKRCLWSVDSNKIAKMDEQITKSCSKDPKANRKAMANPENLELIKRGELKQGIERRYCHQDDNEISDDDWALAAAESVMKNAIQPRAQNDVVQNCCHVDCGDEAEMSSVNPSKRIRLDTSASIAPQDVYQLWLSTTSARPSQNEFYGRF